MSNIIYNGERLLQMVRYSDELLDEIKSKNDIVDIVSQYVVLKRTGRNYIWKWNIDRHWVEGWCGNDIWNIKKDGICKFYDRFRLFGKKVLKKW